MAGRIEGRIERLESRRPNEEQDAAMRERIERARARVGLPPLSEREPEEQINAPYRSSAWWMEAQRRARERTARERSAGDDD